MYQWQYEYQCYTGSHTTCIEAIDTIIGINNVHCKDNELWMTIYNPITGFGYIHTRTHTHMHAYTVKHDHLLSIRLWSLKKSSLRGLREVKIHGCDHLQIVILER